MGHSVDTIIILCVAVINALIGYVQENKAEKSLKSIQNMLSSKAVVIRDGNAKTIDAQDLVPGDIVTLKPGIRSRLTCAYSKPTISKLKKLS